MQHDTVIWGSIGRGFCSFRVKTRTQDFCRNSYNITGLCNRRACPLANSRYCTVKEEQGQIYLYMKTIERAHTPKDLWERVKLHPNVLRATEQLDRHLAYWPSFLVKTAKKRMLRIKQYLIRMRRMRSQVRPELVPVIRHKERRDERREAKAHAAAQLQDSIKSELLERLRQGTYGDLYDQIVNFPQREFEEAVEDLEDLAEEEPMNADAFVEAYDDEEDEDDEEEAEREIEYEYEHEGGVRQREAARAKRAAPANNDSDESGDDSGSFDDEDDEEEEGEEVDSDAAPEPCPPPKLSFSERARAARAGIKFAAPAAAAPAEPKGGLKRSRKGHVTLE